MKTDSRKNAADDETKPLTLLELASSCLAAAFGVQSEANKRRDFTRGKPLQFVVIGISFTVIFLLSLVVIVNLVIGS
ncbi:MAG: hypothetical protein ACI92E_003271 [Oceanicoccus sp.]|jgi:hypothetical protein